MNEKSEKIFNVEKIRSDFPILNQEVNGSPLIYFDNAASTQKPISVINSISDYYKNDHSNVHRGVHSLSVRATESLVKPKAKNKKIKKIIVPKGPVRALENQLIEIFGTKVKLKPAQIGGSIEIVYFSDDDLERIIDLLQSL